MQETHSIKKKEGTWNNDIGHQHKAYYAHGLSNKRGVCTIIPKSLKNNVVNTEVDPDGRYLVVELLISDKKYVIFNLYAPTKDYPAEQITFLKVIETFLEKYSDGCVIMGGDWNIVQNPSLDKYNPGNEKPSKPARYLEGIKQNHNLIDIWRIQNPNLRRYTWRRKNPLQQLRLDFWLITDVTNSNVSKCHIDTAYLSDHNMVHIQICVEKPCGRGKGYWKFNNSLLDDKTYCNLIVDLIKKTVIDMVAIDDKRMAWEYLKMIIRRENVSYSIKRSRSNRQFENELLKKLSDLEAALGDNPSEKVNEEYHAVKLDYQLLQNEKTHGQMVRSKATWTEQGERSSKYFVNLERHNQQIKNIKTLYTKDKHVITGKENVLDELYSFYSKLYNPVPVKDKGINSDFTMYKTSVTITEAEVKSLDEPFKISELKEALDELPGGKTPGTDGLTADFF